MRNVLITGGAGFIGANFVRYLQQVEPGVQVINLDMLTYAGSRENLKDLPNPGNHQFVQGNICDRSLVERLFEVFQIDTVVHFAAESHVDRSIIDPEPFIETNVRGTFVLLEAARKAWLSRAGLANSQSEQAVRFHHVSTDEVFGMLEPGDPPFSEISPYAPNSPYAATKAASDHLVRVYGHTYGLPYTITNCSNNYGPYQFPEKLIPLMISTALEGRPLPMYGDGQQVRDWLFVEDHCQAIWTVLCKGDPGNTYTVGGGNQLPNLEVVRTLCEILDECRPESPYLPHEQLITFVADRPGHDRRYAMDSTYIDRKLGWKPEHTLASGLLKTVEWYLEHPEWVDTIRRGVDYQGWLAMNYGERGGI